MSWSQNLAYYNLTGDHRHNDRHAQHQMSYRYSNSHHNTAIRSTAMIHSRRYLVRLHARSPPPQLTQKPLRWERYLISLYRNRRCLPCSNHYRVAYPAWVHRLRREEVHRRTTPKCRMYRQLPKKQRRVQIRYVRIMDLLHRVWLCLRMRTFTTRILLCAPMTKKP